MISEPARRVAASLAIVALAGSLAACGDDGGSAASTVPTAGATSASAPPLLRAPARDGEIVLDGEASPASHGPYAFDGRYLVRFAQYAPEDPRLDFGAQTAFVARLGPARPGPGARYIRLFRDAAASGRRTLDLRGEHTVDVDFGDFPYVIRFTPVR